LTVKAIHIDMEYTPIIGAVLLLLLPVGIAAALLPLIVIVQFLV
jgi:hypothetical protein